MDALPPTAGRALLEMLGARWRVGVSAAAVAWDVATGLAGFALSDGTLALAHPVWEGAPALRSRVGGGAELVPGTTLAPPAARAKAHSAACLSIAADPDGGFLTGGSDGRVTCVQADGVVRVIGHFDGPVSLMAAGAGHWRACAVRRTVHRLGGAAARVDVPAPVTALALDPGGSRLAIACQDGVTLWQGGVSARVLAASGIHAGLAWSPDQTLLASFSPDGTLHAWHLPDAAESQIAADAPITTLAALATEAGFVSGTGGRVICWLPPARQLQPCGLPNQASVTRIAAHPRRPVLAAGYANGTVVLCQPNDSHVLFLRAAGQGAVSALAFSPLGGYLAIGTDGGEIGVLALPNALFRDQTSQQ
jgi:WD40 repeat protein